MRIHEIIGILTEDINVVPALLTVLNYLRQTEREADGSGNYDTKSLVAMVRKNGAPSFEYANLVNAYENNESVKNLIKNINKDTVELKLDSDLDMGSDVQGSEQTVSQLAQRAVNL